MFLTGIEAIRGDLSVIDESKREPIDPENPADSVADGYLTDL